MVGCEKKQTEETQALPPESQPTEIETSVVSSDNTQVVQAAQQAAREWLTLIDNSHFGESWEQAASYFKNAVSRDKWIQDMQSYRHPLGKLLSRSVKSSRFTTSAPGAPDGQYVIIQFNAVFENKRSAVETITPMLDKDNHWRISGYFIR
jgi:hypothetical protein